MVKFKVGGIFLVTFVDSVVHICMFIACLLLGSLYGFIWIHMD